MWKVVTYWVFTLFLCCLVLFSEPGRAESVSHPTLLRFSFWGNFKDLELWKHITAEFEKVNPDIRIKLEFYTVDYWRKLPLMLVSNTAADIILMDDEIYPTFATRGYLEDLSPYIARDAAALRLDDFWPTSLESFTYHGFRAGLPWDGMAMLMFFNKDIFDQAGLPYPSNDWTWAEYRDIAKKLTRDFDGDGRTDQYGTLIGFQLLGFEPLLWSFDADILNPERTQCALQTPEAQEAFRYLYTLRFTDRSIPQIGEIEGFAAEVQLLTGRIGMELAGSYMINTLQSVKGGMNWGVAPVPKGPRGNRYTRLSWDGISINKVTPYKEQAWRFIRFLLGEESQAYITRVGRGVPVHQKDAQRYYPEVVKEADVVLQSFSFGKLTPITPKYIELAQVYNDLADYIETPISSTDYSKGKMTTRECIDRMEVAVNGVMAKELAKWGKTKDTQDSAAVHSTRLLDWSIPVSVLILIGLLFVFSKTARAAIGFRFLELRDLLRSQMGRNEAFWGTLFASPWLLGVCLFTLYPIYFSITLSFSDWDPYDPVIQRTFVGLLHFKRALTSDPMVWKALYNTFYYAIFAVPLGIMTSLSLAMLLNQKLRGITLFRTIFYIPSIVGGVATSILWTYIFNPSFGPINGLLHHINTLLHHVSFLHFITLPEPGWLTDPFWAKPSLIIMSLWGAGGAGMLIFLAGLQGVPDQLYEVADLDGASRLRKFWHITLPMLTPTIYFNFIMGLIGSLQVFMQAFVMTDGRGGTDKSLLFYVFYLYQKAFVEYDMGYASALAWILFVIILSITMAVIKSSALWVYYEGEKNA